MEVALRKRYGDACILESIPNSQEYVTASIADPIGRVVDPKPQLEVDGVVPESREQTAGRGVMQDPAIRSGRIDA